MNLNTIREGIQNHRFIDDRIEVAKALGYRIVWIKATPGPEGSVIETPKAFYVRLGESTTECYSYMAEIKK